MLDPVLAFLSLLRSSEHWATEIDGTEGSIAFSTKLPKTLRFMDSSPAGGRRGRLSTLARSRRTRRSPARSSSSGSPTRSFRCGRRFWTSSRAGARGCGSRSTARRPRRRPRHIGCSPPRSAPTRSAAWSRLPLPGDTTGAEHGFSRLTRAPVSKIVTLSMTTMSSG